MLTLQFSLFLRFLIRFLLGNFLPLELGDSLQSIVQVMVYLEGYFPLLFVDLVVNIDAFFQLQLKDKIQIELKSNFNIKVETKNALHSNHIFTY